MNIKKILLASVCMMTLFAACHEEDELTVKSPSAVITPIVTPVKPIVSFTVSLHSVLLYMSKSSGMTGTVTARIVEVSTGVVKGQSKINVSNINNYAPRWVSFLFSDLALRKGTLHRIEITCSNQSKSEYLQWYAATDNYANGTMGVNESNMSFSDLCFATYYNKGARVDLGQQSKANDKASYVVNRSGLTYWQQFKTEPLINVPL